MGTAFIALLEAGLKLWDDKEKIKYVDQIISIKEQYYAELSKQFDDRDFNVLGTLEQQLLIISSAFIAASGGPKLSS
jgi:hypothetical protein